MGFNVAWAERIQNTRTNLADNVMFNDPTNFMKLTGTLDYLFNTTLNPRTIDVIQNQNANDGKYRTVDIRYTPYDGTDNLITNDASSNCNKVNQRRDSLSSYDVTLFAEAKFTLEKNYVRQNTENGDSYQQRFDREMRTAMRKVRESMSSQSLAKIAGLFGSNPAQGVASGAYHSVQLINSSGGADVDNFDIFVNDQQDNFMQGPIAVIGQGSVFRKYFNRLAVGNVNTNAGVNIADVAQQFGALYFQDQSATANLGAAARVLALYPGLSQIYGYNLFANEDMALESPDNRIETTIADPIYPFAYDMIIEYDNNCSSGNGIQGAWVVRLLKYFDIFTVPTDAFGGSYGELADFNGILGYNITNA